VFDKQRFPTPPALFTIDELGGWDKVKDEFFDEENGIVTEIQREDG
jgi:sulfate transport system substrate-binding protein